MSPEDPSTQRLTQESRKSSWRGLQRDEDLNVVDENGDDNDYNYTDKNEGYDSKVVDDVTDVINATNKSRITKCEKILERQAFYAEVIQKAEDSDKRKMQQKLFDKL